jgi:5-methylthioadenosine/S-adenosylhomocysteine deaminase
LYWPWSQQKRCKIKNSHLHEHSFTASIEKRTVFVHNIFLVGSYSLEGKVQEMGEAGLLRENTTYLPCTTLNDIEIQMIVDTGGTVSLAAPVEMMMGYGMPPIQKFLDRGLKPSLSVDVETNVPGDMFTQMRSVAALQHGLSFEKANGSSDRITSYEVLSYATIEGARANGLAHKTGSLTPGKEADLILLRTDKPNVFPVNDPVGAVVWSMDTSNVDTVFVAGRLMKRNGQLLHVDWSALKKAVLESRDYVMKKSGFKMPAL